MTSYIHLIPEAYSEGKHGIPKGMLVVDLIFIPAIEMAGYIISMPEGILHITEAYSEECMAYLKACCFFDFTFIPAI